MLPTRLRKTVDYGISPIIEQYLTYKNTLGKHDFSVMAGSSWRSGSSGGSIQIFGEGLDLAIENVKTAPTNNVTTDDIWKNALLSYFGRINYQFNNKYLLTLNIRTDASPKFAPSNRWGTFPSIAVAWKMHEEEFIKRLNIFDQLKLRAGMGTSGNDNIGDFRYLSQVYTLDVYTPFGNGVRHNGATVINNSSNDIRWETTKTNTIGADMAFLDNRLTLSAEYYNKETSDILYGIPQPVSLGYGHAGSNGSAIVNAASMENKGFDLQLDYRSNVGKLRYSIGINYSHNKNNVISLGEGSYLDGINRTDIGHPIGYFYGYVADGIFMTQQELDDANEAAQAKDFSFYQDGVTRAGDVRFKDVNNDGHIDDKDRTYLGSPHPTHLYGANISLDYKGFDFNVILQGIGGSSIYDGNYDRQRGGQYILNQFTYVNDRWKSESDPGNGIVPRVAIGDPAQNNRASSLKLTNGSYLKIRQISLGYSLPKDISSKIGMDNLRIYASADNYFTFSKWNYGYDPEVGGDNLYRGIDRGNHWPRPKLLMFGIQVQL
jgi:TonB-linked SusC/RagA family outer membrane protein